MCHASSYVKPCAMIESTRASSGHALSSTVGARGSSLSFGSLLRLVGFASAALSLGSAKDDPAAQLHDDDVV